MSKEFEDKVLKKLEQLDVLTTKVENLSEELKEFKTEQRIFNAKQEAFNAKQEAFNAKQMVFNTKQLEFNAKQEELNKKILERLSSVERNVLIIENKVSNDIPALFDANETRYQKQTQFENDLDSLGKKTESNSVRILALEYTSEKHEEKLKNLVS